MAYKKRRKRRSFFGIKTYGRKRSYKKRKAYKKRVRYQIEKGSSQVAPELSSSRMSKHNRGWF